MTEARITQIARSLGVTDGATISKANELYRLYDSKGSYVINDVAKIVFSIECATTLLNVEFDRDTARNKSTLKPKIFEKEMQIFCKALQLTKSLQVVDLCIQLELDNNVKQAALKLLNEYKKQLPIQSDIMDAKYVTMAVHQACKHYKVKGGKIKKYLKEESRLNPMQWGKLEETWTKWIEKEQPLQNKPKVLKQIDEMDVETNGDSKEVKQPKARPDRVLPYEDWKEQILKKANALISQGGYD